MDPFLSAQAKLPAYEACVAASALLRHTVAALRDRGISAVRCLALGSPTQELQALYQLAYMRQLVAALGIDPGAVSLHDPAFTADDRRFLSLLHYSVRETECSPNEATSTLYYMPHAPRSVTEAVVRDVNPVWLLGNDLSVTMGALTRAQFLESYPHLATLVHMVEKAAVVGEIASSEKLDDEFQPVNGRRRKARKNKSVYVEKPLHYDVANMYFESVQITRLHAGSEGNWKNSFSDLALNVIKRKGDHARDEVGELELEKLTIGEKQEQPETVAESQSTEEAPGLSKSKSPVSAANVAETTGNENSN